MKNKALNLPYKLLIILSIFAILPACSSSDDDDDASNSAPSVSAGEDQTVNQGATVDLVGVASDSDGSISSWLWKQTSGSHSVTIKNSTTSNAYFSAPTVDTETTLVFELEVKDNDGASVSDSMRVTVLGPGDSVNPLPDNFEAVAGDGQVTLTWSHHSDASTDYNIYRSSASDCELANYTSCADGDLFTSKSSGFVDDDLTNGTTYYYWIEAILDGFTYLDGDFISATPRVDDNIDLTDGLVAHYEFDGDASDSSGNGNHGEVVGATLTEDRFGEEDGAYHIAADSSFDRISLPAETIDGLGDFTIASWIRIRAKNTNHATLFSVAKSGSYNELALGYSYAINVWEALVSSTAPSERFSNVSEVLVDQWTHIAYTRQEDAVSVYVNGIHIESREINGLIIESANNGVIIGQDQDSVGGDFDSTQSLNGDIDSFRIYSRALSSVEVQALYELNNNLANGLVAHYKFESDAYDSGGNAYHGEVIGATLTSDRFGEEDGAYHIAADTSYDRISLPAETVNGLEDFTIASWIRIRAKNTNHATLFSVAKSGSYNELALGHSYAINVWEALISSTAPSERFSNVSEILIDQWTHIAYTRQGAAVSVYVNGIYIESRDINDVVIEAATNGVIIGQDQDSLGGDFDSAQSLNGDIDSLRIYNRALSAEEIQTLYELGED